MKLQVQLALLLLGFCIGTVYCWQEEYEEALDKILALPDHKRLLHELQERFNATHAQEGTDRYTFPCRVETRSTTEPISVHRLTAADISVVAAVGDSITAGFGINAWNIFQVLTRYRGFSWSVGGQEGYEEGSFTLPNILKKYNSGVTGYAIGNGDVDTSNAQLNVAVGGAVAADMPEQAHDLVAKMKADSKVDYDHDWKLVTLFIGGNDLCRTCVVDKKEQYSPENYVKHIKDALDILQAEMPRAFVNVVVMLDLTPLAELEEGLVIDMVHDAICPCGVEERDAEQVREIQQQYAAGLWDLIDGGRYDTKEDFTVVLQPFMQHNDIPRTPDGGVDVSFLAPDFFHFSKKGHNTLAQCLWHALFLPVGSKPTSTSYDVSTYCPHKDDVLQTAKNSGTEVIFKPTQHPSSRTAYPENEVLSVSMIQQLIGSSLALNVVLACGVVAALLLSVLVLMMLFITRSRRSHGQHGYVPLDKAAKKEFI